MGRDEVLRGRKEACEACGKRLGEVSYTRRGETGAWCSEVCRDGVDRSQERAARKRSRGRPRKFETDAERQRAYRDRNG